MKLNKSIAILGRQPALGLAELESLYGSDTIKPLQDAVAIVDINPKELDINQLGGTVKLARYLTKLDFTAWNMLTDYLVKHVPKHTCCIGPGKLVFGISTYGLKVSEKQIQRTALEVKKAIRNSDGRPVRVVPTNGTELSSAQVLHNKMYTTPLGMELILIQANNSVYLAQTFGVQNIDAYAARDQARPMRDARVGMLPPKLAQIIINLAVGNKKSIEQQTTHPPIVLDPFCGTGVILQEALLMGYHVSGSDIEPRMIEYTKKNMEWLRDHGYNKGFIRTLEVADATTYSWPEASFFDAIASETYLGPPFTHEPKPETLERAVRTVDTIHKKFLANVARQTKPGFRLTLAVPAWKIKDQFVHLSTLDHLENLGYTRVSFKHAANKNLIYYRKGQIVGRELVTLIRK